MTDEPEPEPEPQCIGGEGHDFRDVKTFADGTTGSRCTKCKQEVVE